MCSLCHKAVGDASHFLSECEALDGERKARRTNIRDVANENFAIKVLNSIKCNEVISEWFLCGDYEKICQFSRHSTVNFNIPVTSLCPFLRVCLCYSIFLSERLSVYVHLRLCSVILGKPYKGTVISNNSNNMHRYYYYYNE